MKKISILMAAFAFVCTSASAQDYPTYGPSQQRSSYSYGSDSESYGTFYLQYNVASIKYKVEAGGHSESESVGYNSATLGYNYAINIAENMFIEPGIAAQWMFKSKDEVTTNIIGAKVPVNFIYSIPISDTFKLDPFAGVYARYIFFWKASHDGDSYNYFDDDESKHFQAGVNIGLRARINDKFVIGLSYSQDLLPMAKGEESYEGFKMSEKATFSAIDITLGINF